MTYDPDGNPITATSPNNQATHNASASMYNHLDRLTQTTLPATKLSPSGGTTRPIWKQSYFADGEVQQVTDPNNHTQKYAYDPWGRLLTSTDPNNFTTTWVYDGFNLASVTDPQGHVTTSAPDGAGRVASVTGPSGDPTHDPGSLVTAYQYDPAGNPTQVNSGGGIRIQANHYDAQNNLVEQDLSGQGIQGMLATKYAPNADGQVAQAQAPNNDLTSYAYDPADELQATSFQPAGGGLISESNQYDSFGNPSQQLSWLGQQRTIQVDQLGRATQMIDSPNPNGSHTITTNSGYDLNGNLTGQTVSEQVAPPSATPTVEAHTYSAAYSAVDWRLTSNDDGLVTNYGYDKAGQLTSLSLPLPVPTGTPTTDSVTYKLDAGGRAVSIGEAVTGTPTATVALSYNKDNQLQKETLPGAVTAIATIDTAGRLIHLTLHGPTSVPTPQILNSSYDYHYDPLGRTTQETLSVNGTVTTLSGISVDGAGRLQSAVVAGTPTIWDYDGSGNLQDIKTNGAAIRTYGYTIGAADQLAGLSVAGSPTVTYAGYDGNGNPGSITSSAGTENVYLFYDDAGRIQSLYRADGGSAVFTYDAQGQRTAFTWHLPGTGNTPSYTQRYQYRDGQLAQLAVSTPVPSVTPTATPTSIAPECNPNDGNGCVESFVYRQDGAPAELLYTPTGGPTQRYWYVLDGRGNVVALTNAGGAVVDRYAYDAWGVPTTISEQVPQPLLYGGYVYDREVSGPGDVTAGGQPVGWYWLSVRHYDPVLERFLQPDPSEQEGTRSYVYAGDDPLDASDPSGLDGICLGPVTIGDCSTNPDPVKLAAGVGLIASSAVLIALAGAGDALFPPSAGANPGEAAAATTLFASGLALARAGLAVSAAYEGYNSAKVLMSTSGSGSSESAVSPDASVGASADSAAIGQQVEPGSTDLSNMAMQIRAGLRDYRGRDLTVAEYQAEDGSLQYDYAFSDPADAHAEPILQRMLQNMGILGRQVTRLYTELEPCGPALDNCRANVPQWFPNAEVTWSFRYPDQIAFRQTSEWKAYIRAAVFG